MESPEPDPLLGEDLQWKAGLKTAITRCVLNSKNKLTIAINQWTNDQLNYYNSKKLNDELPYFLVSV